MSRKFLLPGHNYLGPGNPLNNGKPINKADAIARQHDIAYNRASQPTDIYKADAKAIKEFIKNIPENPLSSIIGAGGLSIKHLTEKLSGKIIYPNLSPSARKRSGQNQSKEEPSTKQPAIELSENNTPEESSIESEIESPPYEPLSPKESTTNARTTTTESQSNAMDVEYLNDEPVNNASVASGTVAESRASGVFTGAGQSAGGGLRGTAPLPIHNRQFGFTNVRIYKKQYIFRIHNETVQTARVNDNSHPTASSGLIRYPFHDIPVHMLGFYLSKAEINQLTQYTKVKVKEVQVDVFNKTGCLNFETQSSISTIGNNNIGIYLCQIDPNINKVRVGSLPSQQIFIEERCWGNPYTRQNQTADFQNDNAHLGAQYVRRNLDNKFEYSSPITAETILVGQEGNTTNSYSSFPTGRGLPLFNPLAFVIKKVNASFEEGHFTTYKYKPKNGLIAGQFYNYASTTLSTGRRFINRNIPLIEIQTAHNNNRNRVQPFTNAQGSSNDNFEFNQNSYFETRFTNPQVSAFSLMTIDDYMRGGENRPPALIIGIEPLTTELNDKWEAVNAYIDLTINTTCIIEVQQGVDYINSNTRSSIIPDYMHPHLELSSTFTNANERYRADTNDFASIEMSTAMKPSSKAWNLDPNSYNPHFAAEDPPATRKTSEDYKYNNERSDKTKNKFNVPKAENSIAKKLQTLRTSVERIERIAHSLQENERLRIEPTTSTTTTTTTQRTQQYRANPQYGGK